MYNVKRIWKQSRIFVHRPEEIRGALEEAKNTPKVPTVIEFLIATEENVFPIVPPGNPLRDMITGGGDND